MDKFIEELEELIEKHTVRCEKYYDDGYLIELENGNCFELTIITDSITLDEFKGAN